MAARQVALIVAIVLLLRLPFLTQPVQGDDPYYLLGAEHALIDPAHPSHAKYIFQGEMVDMRGHPHPPLDSWILAALLTLFGDVYEIPFHSFYILFSLIAAIAMWFLAKRFSANPLGATLLFLSAPAFIINGNSFEADFPFLAFWMAGYCSVRRSTIRNGRNRAHTGRDDGLSSCDRDTDTLRLLLAARSKLTQSLVDRAHAGHCRCRVSGVRASHQRRVAGDRPGRLLLQLRPAATHKQAQ